MPPRHRGEQRHRGCGGEFRLRRILEQAPDLGGHGVEAGRQRQDRGRAEQRHGLQEGDQRARDQRRQRQRNRDAPRRGPGLAAENGGGVLELARHVVERVGDQHEHERKSVAGDHEDDPGQRIDVEDMRIRFGRTAQVAIELVQQPAVGRGQQFPGYRAEERRCHERGRHQRADGLAPRHVGARHQPADRRCNQAADHRRRGGDDRGRQQRIEKIRIGEQLDEILQRRVSRLVGECIHRQPRHRHHDQHDHDRSEQPQHRLGPVDFRLGGRGVGGERHFVGESQILLILRSGVFAASRRMSRHIVASWFETPLCGSSP